MANLKGTANPWVLDTAEYIVGNSTEIEVSGIMINASSDAPVVIIKDGAGNIVFQATAAVTANHALYFPVHFRTTGFELDTITNVTNMLVYRKPM